MELVVLVLQVGPCFHASWSWNPCLHATSTRQGGEYVFLSLPRRARRPAIHHSPFFCFGNPENHYWNY